MIKPKRKKGVVKTNDFVNNELLMEEISKSKKRLEKNPDYPAQALTPKLAEMLWLMVEGFSKSSNWANYTYLEELKGEALIGLCSKWHKFDETKFDNPFGYYTMIMHTRFLGQLKKEKKIQMVRDLILESRGEDSSLARQMENEEQQRDEIEEFENNKEKIIESDNILDNDSTSTHNTNTMYTDDPDMHDNYNINKRLME